MFYLPSPHLIQEAGPSTSHMTVERPIFRSEAEKTRRRVGVANRKVLHVQKVSTRPESFCVCLQNWPQKQVRVFGQSSKFPESLKSFWTVWKISGQSGKFLDSLESLRTVWEVCVELKPSALWPELELKFCP